MNFLSSIIFIVVLTISQAYDLSKCELKVKLTDPSGNYLSTACLVNLNYNFINQTQALNQCRSLGMTLFTFKSANEWNSFRAAPEIKKPSLTYSSSSAWISGQRVTPQISDQVNLIDTNDLTPLDISFYTFNSILTPCSGCTVVNGLIYDFTSAVFSEIATYGSRSLFFCKYLDATLVPVGTTTTTIAPTTTVKPQTSTCQSTHKLTDSTGKYLSSACLYGMQANQDYAVDKCKSLGMTLFTLKSVSEITAIKDALTQKYPYGLQFIKISGTFVNVTETGQQFYIDTNNKLPLDISFYNISAFNILSGNCLVLEFGPTWPFRIGSDQCMNTRQYFLCKYFDSAFANTTAPATPNACQDLNSVSINYNKLVESCAKPKAPYIVG